MSKQLTGATAATENPLSKAMTPETKGKLFVIEPLEVEKDVVTDNGTTDAIRSNIWVIRSKDGLKYDEYLDVLVFPRVIQGQLRRAMGKSVVFGRLTQGEAKPGKNAPWVLADPTPADTAAATAFWSALSLSAASSSDEDGADGFDGDDEDDSF